jgi:flagellar basal body-associated protein FliL
MLIVTITIIIVVVATQFLTHMLINFQKKPKNSKKTMKTPKKCIFDIFALFLAFLTSSQKNLNFQRYLERVQLLTRKFYDH